MDNNEYLIPYIVYESSMAREERLIKRLIGVIVVLIICWIVTIGIGVWYISLPVEEYTNQEVEDVDKSHITQKVGD